MAHTYSFAIIRICPDPRRGEILNIGVIIFLRSGVDVRLLPSLAKVQALYGDLDLSLIFSLPERIAELLPKRGSIARRHELVRRVGIVELSDLGQFSAIGNDEYEGILQELLAKLVRPTPVPRAIETAPSLRLQRQVRKIIKEANLLGRKLEDIEHHKVVTRYPLAPDKGLFADFVARNSQYYFTETLDYRVDRGIQGTKFNETAKAAFVLREAHRQFESSSRIVLYAATAKVEIEVTPHLNLLSEFADTFINFESAQDRARYVEALVSALGGQLPLTVRGRN